MSFPLSPESSWGSAPWRRWDPLKVRSTDQWAWERHSGNSDPLIHVIVGKSLNYWFILWFQFWKFIECCFMGKHGHFWWLFHFNLGRNVYSAGVGCSVLQSHCGFKFSPYWLLFVGLSVSMGSALKFPILTVRDLLFCSSVSFALYISKLCY